MTVDKTRLLKSLEEILDAYQKSFSEKEYEEENNESDLLMEVFGITPDLKRENRQYWGRELGMCWQLLITNICKEKCKHYGPALRIGDDEPCDFTIKKFAIDTKYRIGSGDSGTLKKFKSDGRLLKEKGYKPLLLILRVDNLPAAIAACKAGGWKIFIGEKSLDYIRKLSGFDIKSYLEEKAHKHNIVR